MGLPFSRWPCPYAPYLSIVEPPLHPTPGNPPACTCSLKKLLHRLPAGLAGSDYTTCGYSRHILLTLSHLRCLRLTEKVRNIPTSSNITFTPRYVLLQVWEECVCATKVVIWLLRKRLCTFPYTHGRRMYVCVNESGGGRSVVGLIGKQWLY